MITNTLHTARFAKMMTQAVAMVAVAAVGVMAAPEDAAAQRRGPGHNRPHRAQANIDVVFQQIEVTRVGDGWAIDYTIEDNSWNSLQRAGISASLRMYSPNSNRQYTFRHSSGISSRRGRVIYPHSVSFDEINTIELELQGSNDRYRVARSTYHEQCSPRVRVAIDERHRRPRHRPAAHPHRPHHPQHGGRAQVIAACEQNTRFRSDFDACLDRGLRLPTQEAPSIINACGRASTHSSGLRSCLDGAFALQGDRADTIRACGEVSKFDSGLSSCLTRASRYTFTASHVIRACGAQTNFDSELNACIDAAIVLPPRQASATVTACGQATSFASGFNQCINHSVNLGHDRLSIIAACDQSTNFDSDMNRCLSRVGQPTRTTVIHEHHHHAPAPARTTTYTRTRREVGRTQRRSF